MLLSVIVPAFNAELTIARCIESLLAQSRVPDEIIVVDDASEDRTAQIVARYPVRLIRLPVNGGPGAARNEGARQARGEYLAFTDADCVVGADWIVAALATLADPEEATAAVTGGYAGPVEDTWLSRCQHLMLASRQQGMPAEIGSTITSNLVCRRSAFTAVGGFPIYHCGAESRPVWGNEDEELGVRLTEQGYGIRWSAASHVFHRFRPDIGGFLSQQCFYAEAIMISHFRFPQMWRSRSNYSRGSGAVHVLAAGGAVASVLAGALLLWYSPPLAMAAFAVGAAALLLLALLTITLLRELRGRGESLPVRLRALAVALAVDFAWLLGMVRAVVRVGKGFRTPGARITAISASARTVSEGRDVGHRDAA